MPTALQLRRGTTSQNNSFTGAVGELSVDTTLDTIRIHDGSTAGGFATIGVAATQTLTNKTLTAPVLNTATVGTSITAASADGATLGTAALEWSDLFLADGGQVLLGNDQEVTITHVADSGIAIKHTATADDQPITITLQTGETDIAASDVIGSIEWQAPNETNGTDAIAVCGAIKVVSEGDFSATNNATKMAFHLGLTEVATEKAQLSSAGAFQCDSTLTCTPTAILLIKDSGGSTLKTINGVAAN